MPPKNMNADRKTQKEIEQEALIKKLENIHNIMVLKRSQSRHNVSQVKSKMREVNAYCNEVELDAILSIDELESVIHALITSLKTFQAQSKANLYEVQNQLYAAERKLKDSDTKNKGLLERIEILEKELIDAKKEYEISIQSMHISYVKILEEHFDKIRDSFQQAVDVEQNQAEVFHETFDKAFKSLELSAVWKKM